MAIKLRERFHTPAEILRSDIAQGARSVRAFDLLYVAYFVTPLIVGFDKFFGYLVNWPGFLAPALVNAFGGATGGFLRGVGALEIALALLVSTNPRIGGMVAAAWLWLGVINMLMIPGHFGIALSLLALSCGALALTELARQREESKRP